jgi:hypothetical protein
MKDLRGLGGWQLADKKLKIQDRAGSHIKSKDRYLQNIDRNPALPEHLEKPDLLSSIQQAGGNGQETFP